ncbi:sensor histidine kinase [Halosimplex sp. J119]
MEGSNESGDGQPERVGPPDAEGHVEGGQTDGPNDPAGVTGRLGRQLIPGPIRRNYALKFAVAMLVVIFLVATVGIVSQVQIRGIIEDDAENTLESTATLQADSVSEWMAGMRAQVSGFAGSDVYASSNPDRISEALSDSLTRTSSDVVGLHYVGPDGTIVASTSAELEGQSVSAQRPRWRGPIETAAEASDGEWRIGTSERAYENNGRLLMAFAGRVRVGEGVLVAVGDVRQDFEQLHRSRSIVRTQLLNPEGRDVFASRQPRPSPLAETEAFETAMAGETTTRERDSTVLAFAPVTGADWVVVTEAPKSELYKASETVGRNVGFLVAASISILAVVGFVLGRGTVLPLARLRRRAEAMEDGDLDVDLRTTREDEIGRLFVAFDSMRRALRQQIREAEAAREEAEQSRRELQRQNERLEQFASTVSHDLRNPLNVASGHLRLIERKAEDFGDDVVESLCSHVETIDGAHERMEGIIDDVLALARDGRDIEEPQSVDLETIARDAWATVDSGDVAFAVTGTRTVEADPDRLRQAFENLFRNAVDHGLPDDETGTGSDGDPPLSVEVGLTETGFYVADDGTGIPPDAVDDVFEYGHTTDPDGTGFGLAIVETIVTAHGWSIAVDEGHDGAKFVVTGVSDD